MKHHPPSIILPPSEKRACGNWQSKLVRGCAFKLTATTPRQASDQTAVACRYEAISVQAATAERKVCDAHTARNITRYGPRGRSVPGRARRRAYTDAEPPDRAHRIFQRRAEAGADHQFGRYRHHRIRR